MDGDRVLWRHYVGVGILASDNKIKDLRKILAVEPHIFETMLPTADPEGRGSSNAILHMCLAHKRMKPQTLRFILDNGGKTLINTPDIEGKTPLFMAKSCYSERNAENIKLLLEYGAIDTPEALKGMTDLHFAVDNTHVFRPPPADALRAAIAAHPEHVFARDTAGCTPPDYLYHPPHQDYGSAYDKPSHPQHNVARMFIEAGAFHHPQFGTWVASQKHIYKALAEGNLLPELFHPDRWKGHEASAMELVDDMEKNLPPEYHDQLHATDFIALAREAAAREHRAEKGKFTKLLKKQDGSRSSPGGKL